MSRQIDAVSFDVDGTLYSLGRLKWRFALRHPLLLRLVWALERAREGLRREGTARPDLQQEMDRRLAAHLGWTVERAAAARERLLQQQWPDLLRRVGPWPDLRPLLEGLARRGVRLTVLSDHPVQAKLAALGLHDLPWAARLDCSALGALKPLPQAFQAVLQAVDLPATRVLHVGDRLDADVAGARAVGMRAALLTDGDRSPRAVERAGAATVGGGAAAEGGGAGGTVGEPIVFSRFSELDRRLCPLLGEDA